tara:strand:+ start:455 stop:625 length:171 start_codon:yes stop_codon:yes gene_type:complete
MYKNKYPNGYQPKIEYWQYKLDKAIKNNDPQAMGFAYGKLEYFMNRQLALQGETIA